MPGRRTTVHEGLRDNAETRVDRVRLMDVKDEIRVLDQIDPEAQRQRIRFPRVHHLLNKIIVTPSDSINKANPYLWVSDSVQRSLVVQEVEHVLYG